MEHLEERILLEGNPTGELGIVPMPGDPSFQSLAVIEMAMVPGQPDNTPIQQTNCLTQQPSDNLSLPIDGSRTRGLLGITKLLSLDFTGQGDIKPESESRVIGSSIESQNELAGETEQDNTKLRAPEIDSDQLPIPSIQTGVSMSQIETLINLVTVEQSKVQSSPALAMEEVALPNTEHLTPDIDATLKSISPRGPPYEIVFIDSSLEPDFQLENADSAGVEVFYVPADTAGIQFISDTVGSFDNLSAIHIVTHGAPGLLTLGSRTLDSVSLDFHADSIENWGKALAPDGDILLYGCSIAQGIKGSEFVAEIAELSHADVAASDDPTGTGALGGNWNLEVQIGDIESHMLCPVTGNALLLPENDPVDAEQLANEGDALSGADSQTPQPQPPVSDEEAPEDVEMAAESTALSTANATPDPEPLRPHIEATKVNVDPHSGSANLSFPIAVPAGRAGIQPSLALTYNSSAKNGPIGVGWMLDVGSVQVSTKGGVPKYDSSDRFVLIQNGSPQELVYYGAEDRYLPENEGSFLRIKRSGLSWTVEDQNGTTYSFGSSNASRVYDPANPSHIFKWALDRVQDINGNDMTFSYLKDSNQLYVSEIEYTGNPNESLSPYARVSMTYASRTDKTRSFLSTFEITTQLRLTEISVEVESNLIREYAFVYDNSSETQRSRLIRLIQYGSDGTSSLPAIEFSYSQGNTSFTQPYNLSHHKVDYVGNGLCHLLDMNGDGLVDLLGGQDSLGTPYDIYLNVSTETKIDFAPSFSAANSPYVKMNHPDLRFVDMNGDGWIDAVDGANAGPEKYRIHINNGVNGFTKYTSNVNFPYWLSQLNMTNLVDMNGDGLTDVVSTYTGNNGKYHIYYYQGAGQFSSPVEAVNSPVRGTDNTNVRFADFNADGLADVIWGEGGVYRIWINNGVNGFEPARTVSHFPPYDLSHQNLVQLVDMNGDSLLDLVETYPGVNGTYKVYFNNGKINFESPVGFSNSPIRGSDNGSIRFMDMNADGLTDVMLGLNGVAWRIWLNNGFNGFHQGITISNHYGYRDLGDIQVMLMDMNADQLPDVLVGLTNEPWRIWKNNSDNNTSRTDILTGVNNDISGQTELTYKDMPIEGFGNYFDGKAYSPLLLNVVEETSLSDSLGHTYRSRYKYEDGLYKLDKREFRGFDKVTSYDAEDNYSISEYHQDDIRKGRTKEQTVYDASGTVYSRTSNVWNNQVIIPDVNFVHLYQTDSYVYDNDNANPKRRTQQRMYYDSFGHVTRAVDYGEVNVSSGSDVGDDYREVETEYHNNQTDWLLGLPKQVTVKDMGGTVFKRDWLYYDYSANVDTVPTQGLLTCKEAWGGGAPNPNIVTRYQYDAYGNLTETIDPEQNSTSIYYDSDYHMFPVRTVNELGHTASNTYYGVEGIPLNSSGYQGSWGQLHSTTDPNNQTGYRVYDVFGRLTKNISPLDSMGYPTQLMEYDYLSTYARVTKYQRMEHGQAATSKVMTYTDGLGREVQTKSYSGQANRYIVSGQAEYNSRGAKEKVYLPYFSSNSMETIEAIDPNRTHTKIDYDAMGRPIRSTHPDQTYSSMEYHDWTTRAINVNGQMQESVSDARGRLVEKREYTGADGRSADYPASAYQLYATTQYNYDIEGNLIQTIDDHGNITSIEYDSLGRKIRMDDPDMGAWTYTYDLNGNLKTQTDAKDQIITFEYDELNRLIRRTDAGAVDVDYYYDETSAPNSKGRLSRVTYSNGQTTFEYDELGREIKSTKVIDGRSYVVERTYDGRSNLKRIKYPSGQELIYHYDDIGQVISVSNRENLFLPAPILTIAQADDQEVALTWTPVPDATSYTIKYGHYDDIYDQQVNLGDVTSYTVTKLTNEIQYRFVVSAKNAATQSGHSNALSATPTNRVDTPVLSGTLIGSSWVDLTWDPVTDATGYKVFYGTSSEPYANEISVGSVTSYSVTHLEYDSDYYFAVKALEGSLESYYSNEIRVRTHQPYYTDDVCNGGTARAGASLGGGYTADLAFDNDFMTSAWISPLSGGSTIAWIEYEFPSPKTIAKYVLHSREPYAMPHSWTLWGHDGSQWHALDTRNYTGWRMYAPSVFTIHNYESYQRYRIDIHSNGGHPDVGAMEIEMMEEQTDTSGYTNDVCSGGTPSASSILNGGYPASAAFDKVYYVWDGWVSGNHSNPAAPWVEWIEYRFPSPKTISKYRVYPRGVPEANPASWDFQAYNGSQWITLDSRSHAGWSWGKYEDFTFPNTSAYTRYRMRITANGGHPEVGFTEMEMFETWSADMSNLSQLDQTEQTNQDVELANSLTDVNWFQETSAFSEEHLLGIEPAWAQSASATVYDDAEDGNTTGWYVYDSDPAGATISNVTDSSRGGHVIQLQGAALSNGYRLRKSDNTNWGNTREFIAEWSMKYSENFKVIFSIKTSAGHRYVYYDQSDTDRLGTETYVHHGLGASSINGIWQRFQRDLQADLNDAQPGVTIQSVEGFLIRGSGYVDDIKLHGSSTLDTQAPSVPQNLSATAVSTSQINLSWDASTDNVAVTGYRIFRNGSQLTSTNSTSYNDTGLTAGTTYTYHVSAYDTAGNASDYSSSAIETTLEYTPAPDQVYVRNIEYNVFGQVTRMEYGNGTMMTKTYDPLNQRLTRILTVNDALVKQQDLNYTYDSAGNILSIVDQVNTATQYFEYDDLSRLTKADGQAYGTKEYRYDEIGNLLEKDGNAFNYGEAGAGANGAAAGPHAVTSTVVGDMAFKYDANGNMRERDDARGRTQYYYNTGNRLTSVTLDGVVIATMMYDGDGGRVKTDIEGEIVRYVGLFYQEEDSGLSTDFIYVGSERMASASNGHIMYYHPDHLGSANVLADTNGDQLDMIEYMPFGKYVHGDPSDEAEFTFTGQRKDDTTGLYFFVARYYDPDVGRFVTPDRVVQDPHSPQVFNRYSYCGNNPINRIDPTGHSWKSFWRSFKEDTLPHLINAARVVLAAAEFPVNPVGSTLEIASVIASYTGGADSKNVSRILGWSAQGWNVGQGVYHALDPNKTEINVVGPGGETLESYDNLKNIGATGIKNSKSNAAGYFRDSIEKGGVELDAMIINESHGAISDLVESGIYKFTNAQTLPARYAEIYQKIGSLNPEAVFYVHSEATILTTRAFRMMPNTFAKQQMNFVGPAVLKSTGLNSFIRAGGNKDLFSYTARFADPVASSVGTLNPLKLTFGTLGGIFTGGKYHDMYTYFPLIK